MLVGLITRRSEVQILLSLYKMIETIHYQPYRDAVKKILEGTLVSNLDQIRVECNKSYLVSEKKSDTRLHPAMMIIAHGAYAENKILQGSDPMKLYGKVSDFPEEFRQKTINMLEQNL